MNDTNSAPSDAVSPPYNEEEEERRWWREMYSRMSKYSRARRDGEGPALSALDIEVRCYMIVSSLSYGRSRRTWSKVLPEIIAHRDALSSTARRVLLRTMKEAAKRLRADADRAEQRAQRFDELVAQLEHIRQSSKTD